ncbi:MAG: DUF937 domain-containing protein [Saprospiraceae bacterium]|nr:DUF937 domain-containing protein [Bacteroidia bacterium]NNF22782.1 DUF937 domain-containing protein [Saprospiraceae bacterium]
MSNSIFDLLQGQLTGGIVEQIAGQLGGADKKQTENAASSAIDLLVGALAKNATSKEGSSALANALERDHDGSILDNFIGMATGAAKPKNDKMIDGSGILKHILGGKQSGAVEMISQRSGLDSSSAGSLLSMLAPLVMGALGKTKASNGLDAGGITDLLTNELTQAKSQRKEMGLIEKFIDQDGDGSIADDVAGFGMKILGGLFKGKR